MWSLGSINRVLLYLKCRCVSRDVLAQNIVSLWYWGLGCLHWFGAHYCGFVWVEYGFMTLCAVGSIDVFLVLRRTIVERTGDRSIPLSFTFRCGGCWGRGRGRGVLLVGGFPGYLCVERL